jgi:hypothetical protein
MGVSAITVRTLVWDGSVGDRRPYANALPGNEI